MSTFRNCTCTKCNKEYEAHFPNDNDTWLKSAICDECFDLWMVFRTGGN
jgi:hypothetical protein